MLLPTTTTQNTAAPAQTQVNNHKTQPTTANIAFNKKRNIPAREGPQNQNTYPQKELGTPGQPTMIMFRPHVRSKWLRL